MARQAASARSTPQGKGKKTASSVKISTKRTAAKRARKPVRASRSGSRTTHLDAIVRVGTAITFAPTGERLRIAKIENGKITFEKLP
jgi:hypothetical protein